MNRTEAIKLAENFRTKFLEHRTLIHSSMNRMMPEIEKNHDTISDQQSELNKLYGQMHKIIEYVGGSPVMGDATGSRYNALPVALSNDILQRRGPAMDASINYLDTLVGRLEAVTDREFADLMSSPKDIETKQEWWKLTNPFYWIWKVVLWFRNHILAGVIIAVVTAASLAYLGLQ